jgi:hypothetical protein
MPAHPQARLQLLLGELSAIPDYLGVLQFGSRARGADDVGSDYDLVVVTTRTVGAERLHARNIDLSFFALSDLHAILFRLRQRQQLPWDTMLADVVVLDDKTGKLNNLAAKITQSIRNQPMYSDGADGLRYILSHFIKKAARANAVGPLEANLRIYSAIAAIITVHYILSGHPWQGLDMAVQSMATDTRDVYRKLEAAASTDRSWADRIDLLHHAAAEILMDHGGLWDGSVLELGFSVENRAEPSARQIPQDLWARIRDAARQVGD